MNFDEIEMLPVMIPHKEIMDEGYKVGDHIRLKLTEEFIEVVNGTDEGELYIIDRYDLPMDAFIAERVLH